MFKSAALLGVLLSGSILMAQQPASNQTPSPDTTLSGTPTPQASPAQPAMRRTPDAGKQTQRLAKELGLNRDQVTQIRPILADRNVRVEQLRTETAMPQKERRARMQAIQRDSKAKIEALLTDAQKQQFEQIMAERRNRNGRSPKA
jgi:hypothetical protein